MVLELHQNFIVQTTSIYPVDLYFYFPRQAFEHAPFPEVNLI